MEWLAKDLETRQESRDPRRVDAVRVPDPLLAGGGGVDCRTVAGVVVDQEQGPGPGVPGGHGPVPRAAGNGDGDHLHLQDDRDQRDVISSRDANLAQVITVTKDGEFYFGDAETIEDFEAIEARKLWMALTWIKADAQWDVVIVRADKDTPCKYVGILVSCLQSLGVDEICFMMEKEPKD